MAITLFSFEDLSSKDKSVRTIQREFNKLGAQVVQTEIPQQTKRTAGITYKQIILTFADSQTVTFNVKKTGDIFQVKLNKKDLPLKNQEDQKAAFKEIVAAMDKGRSAFQKKLARAKVEVPKGVRTAAPKMQEQLATQKTSIQEAIKAAEERIQSLQDELKNIQDDTQKKQAEMNAA